MDLHCLRLIFPEDNESILEENKWAINTGNTSFSLPGAAVEHLNPGEQLELVSSKGDTGCVIAKMILTDTLTDATPIRQPIDNYCYQITKRINATPAYKTKTSEENGVSIEEQVNLTSAIAKMDKDGESLIFTDSHWNIGCVYTKNGTPKQFSSQNIKSQPIDRYCLETFKVASREYARHLTITDNLRTDTDFYTVMGEAIANWEVGTSVTLGAGMNGQSGCIIRKSIIPTETQTTKQVSHETRESVSATTVTSPPNVTEPVTIDTTVPTTTEAPPHESQTG